MTESIQISTILPANAKQIFKAWLNSKEHSAFTGGKASVEPKVGGKYTTWDGYINGMTIEIEPYSRIVQTWKTSDFPLESGYSRLEVMFEELDGGTKVTLIHTGIPEGQGKGYEEGWTEYYFEPMKEYFLKNGSYDR